MDQGKAKKLLTSRSRRNFLKAAGSLAVVVGIATGKLDSNNGNLQAGTMSLDQAYNVAGDLWIGPDSAKSDVAAQDGREYDAVDTGVTYYGDDGTWVKLALGSQAESQPIGNLDGQGTASINNLQALDTEELSNTFYASAFDGANGGEQIQNALDTAASVAGMNAVVVDGAGPDDAIGVNASNPPSKMWVINQTPEIPPNTFLLFRSAYVALADNVDDNLLRNQNALSGDSTRDYNISVVVGPNSTLDGRGYNQTRVDSTNFAANIGLRFYKVDGINIDVQGVVRDTNAYAGRVEDCTGERVNFHVNQTYNGQNQDGFDVVGPAEFDEVTVTGVARDDFVGLFAGSHFDSQDGSGGDVFVGEVNGDGELSTSTGNLCRIIEADGYSVDTRGGKLNLQNLSGDAVFRFGPATYGGGTATGSANRGEVVLDEVSGPDGYDKTVYIGQSPANATIHKCTSRLSGSDTSHIFIDDGGNGYSGELIFGTLIAQANGSTNQSVIDINGGTFTVGWDTIRQIENNNIFAIGDATELRGGTIISVDSGSTRVFSTGAAISGDAGEIRGGVNEFTNTATDLSGDPVTVDCKIPVDVRTIPANTGSTAVHDGTNSNTVGLADGSGGSWTSLVDGTAIS